MTRNESTGRQAAFRTGGRLLAGLCLLATIAVSPAGAQAQFVPRDRAQIELTFAPLVRRVSPAVVNVLSKRIVTAHKGASPLFSDPFFRRFFGDAFPQKRPEKEQEQGSVGSGVIVDPSGLIVTNHHVIEGADEIRVVLADRREFDARLVRDDERTDLAILRIDAGETSLPSLELANSDELEVGDLVLAIGNPFGVGQTVTSGIVSGLARTNVGITDFNFFIQTDAAINPGNSGGALVTMDGRLAGVNTAIFSRSGGNQGIGFAVPANMVRTVLNSVDGGPRLVRPWLGAAVQDVNAEISEAMGLERPFGVLISKLHEKGPAKRAGLRQGDIVVSLNGQPVADTGALRFRIATADIGSKAELTVLRSDRSTVVWLDVEQPPEDPPREETALDGRQPLAGATIVNLSPAVAEEFGLSVLDTGVIVTLIAANSPARRFGFRPRDKIETVNGREVGDVVALRDFLAAAVPEWVLTVRRNGRILTVTLPG